jgi:hypothetical protein
MSSINVDEIMDVLLFLNRIHSKNIFNKILMGTNVVRNEWKMNE